MPDGRPSGTASGAQATNPSARTGAAASPSNARFVTGSTMRHVVVMTATGSVGLVAIFFVDLVNLFYISLLGQQELAAAIGYAGSVLAFTIAVGIGISIGATALVSRALGAGRRDEAKRLTTSSLVFMVAGQLALAVGLFIFVPQALSALGAEGRTHELATEYLRIVVPSTPLLGLGMALSGVLRAVGDANRAMYVTLSSGLATAVLDPIFIFALDFGLNGAAISTILARFVLVGVGWYGAAKVHDLVGRLDAARLAADARSVAAIALPAVATNIATPIGNAYVTASVAGFGDEAVAGWAIVGRVLPVAFGTVFALSGAVGPILGQNYGAGLLDRVRRTLRDALVFTLVYVILVWLLLALLRGPIADLFAAEGEARDLVFFFCLYVAGSFVFSGGLFVANASFNNLGSPNLATAFNWARATLGTFPFCWLGARWFGAEGVLAGWALGGIVFGFAAVVAAFRVTNRLESPPPGDRLPPLSKPTATPLSSGKGQMG